jgi:hypothetical protein
VITDRAPEQRAAKSRTYSVLAVDLEIILCSGLMSHVQEEA